MKRHLLTTYPMPGSGLRRGKCSCGWCSSVNVDEATVKEEFAEHLKTEAAQQINDYRGKLWCDLKTDLERAEFLECGRAHETGIVAMAVQAEFAAAFRFRHEDAVKG